MCLLTHFLNNAKTRQDAGVVPAPNSKRRIKMDLFDTGFLTPRINLVIYLISLALSIYGSVKFL